MASTPSAPMGGQNYVDFDEYVEFQLAKARSQLKLTEVWQGLCWAGLVLVVYLLTFAVCDQWLLPGGFAGWGRWLAFGVAASVLTVILSLGIALPLSRRVSALYAAKMLEQAQPTLHGNLLNMVDLRDAGIAPPEAVFHAIERRAALGLSKTNVDEAVDRRPLLRLAYGLLAVIVVAFLYTVFSPKDTLASVRRALLPAADVDVPTKTIIADVTPGDHQLPAHGLLTVEADIRGLAPERVNVLYTTTDQTFVDQPVEMRRLEPGLPRFRGVVMGENGRGLLQDLTYRIVAGDAHTPTYTVQVVQPPSSQVESVRITYPAYMELPPKTQPGGHIDAWEGSTVELAGTVNMPVKSASVLFTDQEDHGGKGDELRLEITDRLHVRGRWTLAFYKDGTSPNFYHIQCQTERGERDPEPTQYTYKIRKDEPPEISLLSPTGNLKKPANGVVSLVMQASDRDFQLRSLKLLIEKEQEVIFAQELFEGEIRGPSFRGSYDLKLQPLKLKAGDNIQFWLEVKDNRQPTANLTNTSPLNIEITRAVTPQEVERNLADEKQQQQRELAQADEASSAERPDQAPPADADPPRSEQKEPGRERPPEAARPKNPDAAPPPDQAAPPQAEPRPEAERKRPAKDDVDVLEKLLRHFQPPQAGDKGQPQPGEQQPPENKDGDNPQAQPEHNPPQREGGAKRGSDNQPGQTTSREQRQPGSAPKSTEKSASPAPQPPEKSEPAAGNSKAKNETQSESAGTDSSPKSGTKSESSKSRDPKNGTGAEDPGEKNSQTPAQDRAGDKAPSPKEATAPGDESRSGSRSSDKPGAMKKKTSPQDSPSNRTASPNEAERSNPQREGSDQSPAPAAGKKPKAQPGSDQRPGKKDQGTEPGSQAEKPGAAKKQGGEKAAGRPESSNEKSNDKVNDKPGDQQQPAKAAGQKDPQAGKPDSAQPDEAREPSERPAGGKAPSDTKDPQAGAKSQSPEGAADKPTPSEQGSRPQPSADAQGAKPNAEGATEKPGGDQRPMKSQSQPGEKDGSETPASQPKAGNEKAPSKEGQEKSNGADGNQGAPQENGPPQAKPTPANEQGDKGEQGDKPRPDANGGGKPPAPSPAESPEASGQQPGTAQPQADKTGETGSGSQQTKPSDKSETARPGAGTEPDGHADPGKKPEKTTGGGQGSSQKPRNDDRPGQPKRVEKGGEETPAANDPAAREEAGVPPPDVQGQPSKAGGKQQGESADARPGSGKRDKPSSGTPPRRAPPEPGTKKSDRPIDPEAVPSARTPDRENDGQGQQSDKNAKPKSAQPSTGDASPSTEAPDKGSSPKQGTPESGSPAKSKDGESSSSGTPAEGAGSATSESSSSGAKSKSPAAGKPGKGGEASGQPGQGTAKSEGSPAGQGGEGGSQSTGGSKPAGGSTGRPGSAAGGERSGTGPMGPPSESGAGVAEGTGDGSPQAGSKPEEDGDASEPARIEYARKATDLVLKRLKEELDRGDVAPALLKELGWTKEQLEAFQKRLAQQSSSVDDDQSPEAIARRLQYIETLKSLELERAGGARQADKSRQRALPVTNRQTQVPPEYRDQYEAYTRSLSKTGAAAKSSK